MIMLHLLDRDAVARALAAITDERAGLKSTCVVGLVKRNQPCMTSLEVDTPAITKQRAGEPAMGLVSTRRSAQTTNTERKLADLEAAVMDGLMTAPEADRAFGRKPSGSRGRPRAQGQEDFRAWLISRIDRLSDPAAMGRLADRMMRVRQDRTLSHGKRAALMREVNRQCWRCDPDYVERLRAVLAEIDDADATEPSTELAA
jgi:hypothetical protein